MVDVHIDIPYPISITHIPYRYQYRYLFNIRHPISISHIDIPYRHRIISCHSGPYHLDIALPCPDSHLGRQVDPIKPTLKAPGSKRLKLKYDELLSSFAFNFNLRRYTSCLPFHPPRSTSA